MWIVKNLYIFKRVVIDIIFNIQINMNKMPIYHPLGLMK